MVLVGKDTYMLVMLIDRATTGNIYMQYSRESVYNINSIQQKMASQTWQHIFNAHAITGCDTISAMYSIGTKKATRDAPCMPEILVQTPVLLMVKTLSNKIVKRIGEKPAVYAIIQAYNYVITLTHFKFDT